MKIKALLYCTKSKPILRDYRGKAIYDRFVISPTDRPFTSDDTQPILNGKIVAECDYEVEEIKYEPLIVDSKIYYYYEPETMFENKFYEKSCLTNEQLKDYLGDKNGYAIHIKNLHIFDEPIKLEKCCNDKFEIINYAPQNMMYSWLYTNKWNRYILISIRPEWLCKILNGDKTIEVRKKVLKEMLK